MEEFLVGLVLGLGSTAFGFGLGRLLSKAPARVRQTPTARKALQLADGHEHEYTFVDREGWHCNACDAIKPQER